MPPSCKKFSYQADVETPAPSEPPSYKHHPLIEAISTLAVDQSSFTVLSLIFGYTTRPYLFLIGGYLILLFYSIFFELSSFTLFLSNLTWSTPGALSLIAATIAQGIGYCIGELAHKISSKIIVHHAPSIVHYCSPYNLLVFKNSFLIVAYILCYLYLPKLSADFAYGALYATIIAFVQEIIIYNDKFNTIAHRAYALIHKFVAIVRSPTYWVRQKFLIYSAIIALSLTAGALYAFPKSTSIIFTQGFMLLPTLNSFIAVIEQSLIYEYTYRFSWHTISYLYNISLQIIPLLNRLLLFAQYFFYMPQKAL